MKLKDISKIILIFIILPTLSYAEDSNSFEIHKLNSTRDITLEDAEILITTKMEGELYSSYTIHNLKGEEVYFITIKKEDILRSYLIEQDGSIEFVEELNLNKKDSFLNTI